MTMNDLKHGINNDTASFGHVYIMTHSLFSNVIRIGCIPTDTTQYAKSLSGSGPGHYELYFSVACDNPCKIKKQLRQQLNAKQYVNEFYEVPAKIAKDLLKREIMKIPVLSIH